MTKYRVQRMTQASFDRYMSGYNSGYSIEELIIEANSPEEARQKAEKEGYQVNKYVPTLEQVEREEREKREYFQKILEKKEKAKAKRKATEARKAEEAGLTVEENRSKKAHKAQITRVEREIERLEKELKEKKNELKRLTK